MSRKREVKDSEAADVVNRAGIAASTTVPGNGFSGGALRCLAVARGTQHAAKHVSNDALMFELVRNALGERGWTVECVPESDLAAGLGGQPSYDCIISMAQRPENVALLGAVAASGVCVVNTPAAVTNCYRTLLVEMLQDSEVPFGRSLCLKTGAEPNYADVAAVVGADFWLKRGDIHAAHENDVCRVRNEREYRAALADFKERSIASTVAQEHLQGDVVKFYAVRGGTFFHAQYFETEETVGFDTAPLAILAEAAAARVGLSIYGGDVVMTSAGPVLIDLNAWPSFGRVRGQAAPKMADEIVRQLSAVRTRAAN